MAKTKRPTTMNVSLPASMRSYVERRVASGEFSSASEFIRALVRNEKARAKSEREELERLLLEGLDSGPAIEVTPAYWEERKARLHATLAKRGKRKAG